MYLLESVLSFILIGDVKLVFIKTFSNCVRKIRILFKLRLGPESDRSHSQWVQNHNGTQWFADWVAQLVLEYLIAVWQYNEKNNNNNNVLFIVCTADHYYMEIMDEFQSEIQIPNVCNSNLNSNFKNEVWKFELRLTSLILIDNIAAAAAENAFHCWIQLPHHTCGNGIWTGTTRGNLRRTL